jgi:tetratricopeptide (TPR) repeat protein
VEAAAPEHPSLVDVAHVTAERFGMTNVPSGVWIDEEGIIVRPPEPAWAERPAFLDAPVPEDVPEYRQQVLRLAKRQRIEPEPYVAALRDWAALGSKSRYVLSQSEVLARSQPRPPEAAAAAAHFELAQHLYRGGREDEAVAHFREAHRLQPDNIAYKRQAYSLADAYQRPTGLYDSDLVSDIERIGPENYYPPLDL